MPCSPAWHFLFYGVVDRCNLWGENGVMQITLLNGDYLQCKRNGINQGL